MKIRLLGAHNCESQTTRLSSLLIDDCLAIDAGGLTSSLSFPAQEKLKAILLTHQHYDHIRDIPALAMNRYLGGTTIEIYAPTSVHDALTAHLLNGQLYPDFLALPEQNPTIKLTVVEPLEVKQIEGYRVLTVPVSHAVAAVGYQATSSDGKAVFYTGDAGPGLAGCWEQISPQLLITEVTVPDSYAEFGRESGHLTPTLLKHELTIFREFKGYLPQVVTVHMSPGLEDKIRAEIASVAQDLAISITPGYEGMQLTI